MPKVLYPEDYTDADKAIYDDLLSRGQLLLGKKVAKQDEFLIDMAIKMTINQINGFNPDTTYEERMKAKESHQNACLNLNVETPENMYEAGEHPLEKNPIKENIPHNEEEKHPEALNLIQ